MQYDAAFDRICEEISNVLVELGAPTSRTVQAASRATRDLAAALRLAAGSPHDPLWYDALRSLERFLYLCREAQAVQASTSVRALQTFLDENGDVLSMAFRLEQAS